MKHKASFFHCITVTTTVKDSVKSECKGYAEAVKNSCNPVMSPQTLKNLVKQVVKEKDRSRNLIVFGLEENEKEIISEKIGDLLEMMGERPKTEAYRLEKFSSEKTSLRPVKVTMTSAGNVHHFLEKAKQLKKFSKYSKVFLSPDRSPGEREAHKLLVMELKKRIASDPQWHHFIRNSAVCSDSKVD